MLCRGVYFPPVTVLSPRHHVFIRYMKPICRDSTDSHLFLKPLRYRLGLLVFPSRQRSTSRRHCRRGSWHLSVFTVERLPLLSVLVPPPSRTFKRTVSKW